MNFNAQELFFKGNYKKVISGYRQKKSSHFNVYVLAAFSFSGQIDEAEYYFTKFKNKISPSDMAKSYFFLVVGWTRHSRYEKSKDYLFLLFRLRHQLKKSEDRFYLFQSFGFYRHLGCRFNKSLLWSKFSQKYSFHAEFIWGQILAYDLLGHSQVQTSFIQHGLKNLALARDLALGLKLNQTARTLEVSILCYRGQFGLDPHHIVSQLEKNLRLTTSQDTYSKSNLVLELCRQHTLRGQLKKAATLLQKSQEQILAVGHRRQKAQYFLRLAVLNINWNKKMEARRLLQEAEKQLDPKLDLSILFQIKKMSLRMDPQNAGLKEQCTQLSYHIGADSLATEDHLSQIMNSAENLKTNISFDLVQKILESENYNLLRQFLNPGNSRSILMDLLPGSLTFIDQDDVFHINECLTPTLKKALALLSQGEVSKAQFIEKIWGYDYDSLRHDYTIYALINRLKKVFSDKRHWIELLGPAYHLKVGTEVIQIESQLQTRVTTTTDTKKIEPMTDPLNLRQIKVLNFLKENESISVKTYSHLFAVTPITANRDLTDLLKKSHLQRFGKGRATVYCRQ